MAEKYHDRRHMLEIVDEEYVSGSSDLLNTWLVGEGCTSQIAYVHRLGKFLHLARQAIMLAQFRCAATLSTIVSIVGDNVADN